MEGHAKKCVERYCELANRTTQQLYKVSTIRAEINFELFRGFLELISRFEFEFCRRENYFF